MTKEEHTEILNWLCGNFYTFTEHRDLFVEATLYEDDTRVPKVIWEIRNRIIKKEGLEKYAESYNENFFLKFHGSLQGVTRDKISIIHPGNELSLLMPHRDINQTCRIHTRFNVYLSVPEKSGTTYYDGHIVEMKERGYVLCRSGMDVHWTDLIYDYKPRITLSFGFMLPLHVLNRIYQIPVDKYIWRIANTKYFLYRAIGAIVGIPDNPTIKNLKCDVKTPDCLPSRPIPKDSKSYKTRPRGFPPFNERKHNIY